MPSFCRFQNNRLTQNSVIPREGKGKVKVLRMPFQGTNWPFTERGSAASSMAPGPEDWWVGMSTSRHHRCVT